MSAHVRSKTAPPQSYLSYLTILLAGALCLMVTTGCGEERAEARDGEAREFQRYVPEESEWRTVYTHPEMPWLRVKECLDGSEGHQICSKRRVNEEYIQVRGKHIPMALAKQVDYGAVLWADTNGVGLSAACTEEVLLELPRVLSCGSGTDVTLSALRGAFELEFLHLRSGAYEDGALQNLSSATALEDLEIWSTRLTGAGVAHLKGATNMRRLALVGKKLDDTALEQIGEHFPNLETLLLDRGEFTEEGWAHLYGKTSLRRLLVPARTPDRVVEALRERLPGARVARAKPENFFRYVRPSK